MSGKVVGWAMEQRTGSPITKLVLLKLADNAGESGFCWPSMERLVEHTELSERSIREHLKILEDGGFIRIERRFDGKTKLPSHYHLNLRRGADVVQDAHNPPHAPDVADHMQDVQNKEPSRRNLQEEEEESKSLAPLGEAKVSEEKSSRSPPKTLIGEYQPDEHSRALAVAHWEKCTRPDLPFALDQQVSEFRAHHLARGTRMADWPAAWQTWYCNAVRYTKPPLTPTVRRTAPDPKDDSSWRVRLGTLQHGGWATDWGPKPGEAGCRVPAHLLKQSTPLLV